MSKGDTFEIEQTSGTTLVGTLHDPQATTGQVLTVQTDKSIAAAPGGGSMSVLLCERTITSAELLAIDTNPVELVATPGAGKMLAPILTDQQFGVPPNVWLIPGATPYVDNSATFVIYSDDPVLQYWIDWAAAGWIDQASGIQAASQNIHTGFTGDVSGLIDVPLSLGLFDGSAPTAGDGTVRITFPYYVVSGLA